METSETSGIPETSDTTAGTGTTGDGQNTDGSKDTNTLRFIDIDVGQRHTCAITLDDDVICWGRNDIDGRLGRGDAPTLEGCEYWESHNVCLSASDCCVGDREAISELPRLGFSESLRAIQANGWNSCILTGSGAVRCWGHGHYGLLGSGTTESLGDDELATRGVELRFEAPVTRFELSRGHYPGKHFDDPGHNRHACALLADGSVRCWGSGELAALGYGHLETLGDDESAQAWGPVPMGGRVSDIAVGGAFTCVLLEDANVRCFGTNYRGEMGNGGVVDRCANGWAPLECFGEDCCLGHDRPAEALANLELGGRAMDIVAGANHACAHLEDDRVICWGHDWLEPGLLPIDGEPLDFGPEWHGLTAGHDRTCAIAESGMVMCYGAGGNGSREDINFSAPIVQLSLGQSHACALDDEQRAYCWGRNDYGQLGYPVDERCYNERGFFDCNADPICCVGDDEPAGSAPAIGE